MPSKRRKNAERAESALQMLLTRLHAPKDYSWNPAPASVLAWRYTVAHQHTYPENLHPDNCDIWVFVHLVSFLNQNQISALAKTPLVLRRVGPALEEYYLRQKLGNQMTTEIVGSGDGDVTMLMNPAVVFDEQPRLKAQVKGFAERDEPLEAKLKERRPFPKKWYDMFLGWDNVGSVHVMAFFKGR